MPRLESFQIRVFTGEKGKNELPHFIINGFPLEFEQAEGSTEPGGEFVGQGSPGSFPHTLLLAGPEEGEWHIKEVELTYFPDGEEPYKVRLGDVTLDDNADLNIWHPRPLPTFDV
jgi:hypothetical protein